MEPDGAPEPAEVLNGWKEIAAHLGRSARSVQRWERDLGLPIHRIKTPDAGSIIYALKSEVDAWRTRQGELASAGDGAIPDRDNPSALSPDTSIVTAPAQVRAGSAWTWWLHAPIPAWAALALAGIAVAAVLSVRLIDLERGTPATWEFEGRDLRAYTNGGHALWAHSFGQSVSHPTSMRGPGAQADVHGDSREELLVPVRFAAPGSRTVESDAVVAFGADGSVIWSIQPTVRFTATSETFEGPWQVRDIATGMSAQGLRTWIAYSHHTWWPAFVLEVAPNGASHLKYVQPGRIYSLTYWRTPTDTWLVAGGTLNEASNASAALVNVNRPPARWRVDSGPDLDCATCPEARPGAMFLLPTADVTRALSRPYGWVVGGRVRPGGVQLVLNDGFGQGSLATLAENLRVTSLARSDRYWQVHQDLESQGRITHPVDACPDRLQPQQVRRWMPATGWSTDSVMLRRSVTGKFMGR